MSNRADKTTTPLAGLRPGFPTTHWTNILDARSHDEPRQKAALEELLRKYWKPVYCYLRCKGCLDDEAKDLTQGFFHEIVLGRGVIQQADRSRGRFRTFLLTCLNHYTTSVHRAAVTKQRMPAGGLVSLEEMDGVAIPQAVQHAAPGDAFDYAWACSLLDQVLADVAKKCCEKGDDVHWELFRARVVQPILDNAEPLSLTDLCQKYGIRSKADASNMIFTVKRQFRAEMRRHVRDLVESDDEVDDEIRDLMTIFSKGESSSSRQSCPKIRD